MGRGWWFCIERGTAALKDLSIKEHMVIACNHFQVFRPENGKKLDIYIYIAKVQ